MKDYKGYENNSDLEEIDKKIINIEKSINENKNEKILSLLFNCIDLTSLNEYDTVTDIETLTEKVNNFNKSFPEMQNVAAICVYPSLVPTVKETLREKSVNIASVSAGFPSSQTFLSIKAAETELVARKGANEIDIVMSIGLFLEQNYKKLTAEISIIKETVKDKKLKVILETGDLKSVENIYKASILAMESGADFIKTSTGKTKESASPEAVYTMCCAIKEFYQIKGKKIGIKPSGGIVTSEDAILYYLIVKTILGEEWLNNKLLRFGASRLANNLLTDINTLKGDNTEIKYF